MKKKNYKIDIKDALNLNFSQCLETIATKIK